MSERKTRSGGEGEGAKAQSSVLSPSPFSLALSEANRLALVPMVNQMERHKRASKTVTSGQLTVLVQGAKNMPERAPVFDFDLPGEIKAWGRGVTCDNTLGVEPSYVSPDEYHLSVKFPQGWAFVLTFKRSAWPKIKEALRPVLTTGKPRELFELAQTVMYGQSIFFHTAYMRWVGEEPHNPPFKKWWLAKSERALDEQANQ